jgi:hypothetical protein
MRGASGAVGVAAMVAVAAGFVALAAAAAVAAPPAPGAGGAAGSGLVLRPREPFECHFHLIRTPKGLLVMDVGRSRGVRFLRFFVADETGSRYTVRTATAGQEEWGDDASTGRLWSRLPGFAAELSFRVVDRGYVLPPANPGHLISLALHDHPLVAYQGWYDAGAGRVDIGGDGAGAGLLSQHFGLGLPEYVYLASVPTGARSARLIGAFLVQKLRGPLPITIRGAYLMVETAGRRALYTSATHRIGIARRDAGQLVVSVRSLITRRLLHELVVHPADEASVHVLEGIRAYSSVPARFRFDGRELPTGIVDAAGRYLDELAMLAGPLPPCDPDPAPATRRPGSR